MHMQQNGATPGLFMPDHQIGPWPALMPDGPFFSGDSSTVYVSLRGDTVNIGALLDLTFHWWFTILASLVLLVCIARTLRILRRPQTPSAPHCRKCNYNLAGATHANGTCPECGTSASSHPPTIGRRFWPRARAWCLSGLVIALLITSAWLWVPQKKRGVLSRLNLRSQTLLPLVERIPALRTSRYNDFRNIALAIDVRSGTVKPVYTHTTYWGQPSRSPDGLHYYRVNSAHGGRIEKARIDSGEVVASIKLPRVQTFGANSTLAIGHLTESSEVLVACADGASPENSLLLAWNPKTGSSRTIIRTPSYQRKDMAFSVTRGFALIPGNQQARYLTFPDFMQAYDEKKYELTFFDASGNQLTTIDLGTVVNVHAAPAISPDGLYIYLPGDISNTDSTFRYRIADLLNGVVQPSQLFGQAMYSSRGVELSPDGHLLFRNVFFGIHIREMTSRRWRAALAMPSEYFGITTVASPDGKYIAGFAQSGGNAATSQTSLFIWRVPQSQPEGYDGVSTIELNPHTPTKPNTRPGN
jgi:hypothetical protein